jgi:hypothetical protein
MITRSFKKCEICQNTQGVCESSWQGNDKSWFSLYSLRENKEVIYKVVGIYKVAKIEYNLYKGNKRCAMLRWRK